MTQEAVFTLYAIEQSLVTNGASDLPDSAETAELVGLGILAGKGGAWTLTEYGWQVAHAFRRFRVVNAGPLSVGVTPPFTPPPPADEQRAVRDVARSTFSQMMATTPDAAPAPVATKAIAAAQAFVLAQKAAGLPIENGTPVAAGAEK
jgi:hypothetical protein